MFLSASDNYKNAYKRWKKRQPKDEKGEKGGKPKKEKSAPEKGELKQLAHIRDSSTKKDRRMSSLFGKKRVVTSK